jgi:hypothetical protein
MSLFTVYRDGCIGANNSAYIATSAAFNMQFCRMISFGGQSFHIQDDNILRAGGDTKFASFAIEVADFNPTFYGHELNSLRENVIVTIDRY